MQKKSLWIALFKCFLYFKNIEKGNEPGRPIGVTTLAGQPVSYCLPVHTGLQRKNLEKGNEPGKPNGVTTPAGLPVSYCHRAPPGGKET